MTRQRKPRAPRERYYEFVVVHRCRVLGKSKRKAEERGLEILRSGGVLDPVVVEGETTEARLHQLEVRLREQVRETQRAAHRAADEAAALGELARMADRWLKASTVLRQNLAENSLYRGEWTTEELVARQKVAKRLDEILGKGRE